MLSFKQRLTLSRFSTRDRECRQSGNEQKTDIDGESVGTLDTDLGCESYKNVKITETVSSNGGGEQ